MPSAEGGKPSLPVLSLQCMLDMGLMKTLEILAVVLGLAYVLLAIRRNIGCWVASYVASGLFVVVFLDAGLVFQPWLQIFYMVMAAYGYRKWRRGARNPAKLGFWGWRNNLIAGGALLALSIPVTLFVAQYSSSPLLFIDVLTAIGAPLATYMQARKYIENWIWWIVLDATYLALYLERSLYFTAVLYTLYLVLAWVGYRAWRRDLTA